MATTHESVTVARGHYRPGKEPIQIAGFVTVPSKK